uniref:Uncharacterized protein n=1 Tax=Rhizophagus irregularis (strain DAOM 181602 / DAOM 197198 / MUCL 43194) TaxID=747089 RepID=U9TLM2_RHIID
MTSYNTPNTPLPLTSHYNTVHMDTKTSLLEHSFFSKKDISSCECDHIKNVHM